MSLLTMTAVLVLGFLGIGLVVLILAMLAVGSAEDDLRHWSARDDD